MLHVKVIKIKKRKIDVQKAIQYVSSPYFGAIILFTGTVRNENNKKKVKGVSYDSHDKLVIKSIKEIYSDSTKKLNIKKKAIFVEHAKGYLKLGEKSIVIAVGCKHRGEAYKLSRFFIEQIKKRTPVWKKEHYIGSNSSWLKGVSIKK